MQPTRGYRLRPSVNDGSGELKSDVAPASAASRGKLNNLGTGQCTVPETPIPLRVRRVGVVTTENATSVSPRVVNRTQAHRFRVVIARKWPRARSSSLIFDHPLRS